MKPQAFFSSRLLKSGNPNHSTPWGRYRHGCDPPLDCQRQSKASCSTCTSGQVFCRIVQPTHFSFLLETLSPFQDVHRAHKPQPAFPFREVFFSGMGPPLLVFIVIHNRIAKVTYSSNNVRMPPEQHNPPRKGR